MGCLSLVDDCLDLWEAALHWQSAERQVRKGGAAKLHRLKAGLQTDHLPLTSFLNSGICQRALNLSS